MPIFVYISINVSCHNKAKDISFKENCVEFKIADN